MDHEFDKEIDAILRKAHRDGPVYVGDVVGSRHLDADEISAFAENAMPGNSRALYAAHLAECDRCRKILGDVLIMNAEAAPAASPGVITIAERSVPWYRQLFAFPNLAYVMGGLVLVFGGLLTLNVIQRSKMNDGGLVSQVSESQPALSGPNAEQFEPSNLESGNSANAAANAASTIQQNFNAAANANLGGGGGGGRTAANTTAAAPTDSAVSADTSLAGAPVVAPPAAATGAATQPVLREAPERERDDAKAKTEDKVTIAPQEQAKADAVAKDRYAGVPSQSGPMRNSENQYNRQLENLDRRAAAKRAQASRDEESSAGRRVVAGKTFERKQGVWYDVTYQGRPTINVRRGTDEFNRLDSGLRSIANSLSGTVVIVWGAKAYRVQ